MSGTRGSRCASSAILAASRFPFTTRYTITTSNTSSYGTRKMPPSPRKGYARATGKVGVCCATSGPGATNLVTGLVDAMMDSIPIVAITGQVTSKLIGSDAFQEADTFGITRSCTKHNYLVKDLARPAAHHPRGVLHRRLPDVPDRCWSIFPRTSSRPRDITRRSTRSICPAIKFPPKATPDRSAAPPS